MQALVRGVLASLVASTSLCLGPAAPAFAAGSPSIHREHFEDTFDDPALDKDCGFDVDVAIALDITSRSFPEGSRVAEVTNVRNNVTFTANGNTVRFAERFVQVVKVATDGTTTLALSGRIFGANVNGRLVVNLETDEVISYHGGAVNRQRLCSRLAA